MKRKLILNLIKDRISENIVVNETIKDLDGIIATVAEEIVRCYKKNRKVMLCGNGGSAADAQHIAAELSGKFLKDRNPLNAEALHVNTSSVTAIANDFGFDHVFERLVTGKGEKNDILIGISTSGTSANIINAFNAAKIKGITTVFLTRKGFSETPTTICSYPIEVKSSSTPRIQESHILIGHIICELVEEILF